MKFCYCAELQLTENEKQLKKDAIAILNASLVPKVGYSDDTFCTLIETPGNGFSIRRKEVLAALLLAHSQRQSARFVLRLNGCRPSIDVVMETDASALLGAEALPNKIYSLVKEFNDDLIFGSIDKPNLSPEKLRDIYDKIYNIIKLEIHQDGGDLVPAELPSELIRLLGRIKQNK